MDRQSSDYGVLLTVYIDKGTQLVSAGEKISEKEGSLDWEKIAETCPAGVQFHNGASKAVVKKMK